MATSSLIGRDAELGELAERAMTNRLVTVVGPGGVGTIADHLGFDSVDALLSFAE